MTQSFIKQLGILTAVVLLIGSFFFAMSLMKSDADNDNFDPDKEFKYLLVDKNTKNSK
jgi:hypothetical protein